MPTVRVAQISDTHLGATRASGSIPPEHALEATVRALVPLRPDLVLLTGDITDGGDHESFLRAAELIEPLRAPVLAVAGNHDLPQPLRARFGGESERVVDAWRILMVDTQVMGEIHGEVDVDAVLRRLGHDEGRPTMLALHHPPITPSANPWFELREGAELVAALAARSDVRLVVGGHLHDVFRMSCGGVTYVGAPSTWYSLEHTGTEFRPDDGEVGAMRIDLFPDGRFDLAVVERDKHPAGAPSMGPSAWAAPTVGQQAAVAEAAERRLFDRYEMIHWTAAVRPTRGEDTIWRASHDAATGHVDCSNHATRAHAIDALTDALLAAPDERVFIGVDFPLGYPLGFADRLSQNGNWRAVWAAIAEEIEDDAANANNRFSAADRLNARAGMSPGPFWGCPVDQATSSLTASKPATLFGLQERRLVERRLVATGQTVPPVWQLAGKGSRGSEALLGIAALRRLTDHPTLARRIRVWPFDTGCAASPTRGGTGAVVIGQVWPGSFDIDVDEHSLRDVAVAMGVCRHLARLDAAGDLGALFAPSHTVDEARVVEREEGWILGA
jgi:predicted phosphodiesterase